MDAYIQTALGIFVSMGLFMIGYKQTIGARKERVQAANKTVHRALLRRMVLENYKPRVKDIVRMLEGKAREFQVSAGDLVSEEQVLTQLFTEVFDNDFIAPTQRADIEERIDEAFDEIIRERVPREGMEREPLAPELKATRDKLLVAMGVATSMLGAVTALMYTLTKERWFQSTTELPDFKLLVPVIGVFLGSLAAVAAISLLKRTREVPEELVSRRSAQIVGAEFEKEIATLLKKHGYSYEVEPAIGDMRPDFMVASGNRRIAIEAKAWRMAPPLNYLARVRDYASALLATNKADEVIIVTKVRVPIAENMAVRDGIKFLTIKELPGYLQSRRKV